jgi:hypothetical protein
MSTVSFISPDKKAAMAFAFRTVNPSAENNRKVKEQALPHPGTAISYCTPSQKETYKVRSCDGNAVLNMILRGAFSISWYELTGI